MSIELTDYISCWRCDYLHIGRYVRTELIYVHNGFTVFEDYTTLICLQCGTIQRTTNHIREVRI